jgi:hypothetical protein
MFRPWCAGRYSAVWRCAAPIVGGVPLGIRTLPLRTRKASRQTQARGAWSVSRVRLTSFSRLGNALLKLKCVSLVISRRSRVGSKLRSVVALSVGGDWARRSVCLQWVADQDVGCWVEMVTMCEAGTRVVLASNYVPVHDTSMGSCLTPSRLNLSNAAVRTRVSFSVGI